MTSLGQPEIECHLLISWRISIESGMLHDCDGSEGIVSKFCWSCLATSNTEDSDTLKWPTLAELNMRVRRLVSRFQKQQRQMRSRLMGLDQSMGKSKIREKEKV